MPRYRTFRHISISVLCSALAHGVVAVAAWHVLNEWFTPPELLGFKQQVTTVALTARMSSTTEPVAEVLPVELPEEPPEPSPEPVTTERKPTETTTASETRTEESDLPLPDVTTAPARPAKSEPQRPSTTSAETKVARRPPSTKQPALELAAVVLPPVQQTSVASGAVDQFPRPVANNPHPPYPPGELAAGHGGQVMLRVAINARGTVDDVRIEESSGFRLLDDSASRTVTRWRFSPAQRGGVSVAYEVLVPVRFVPRRAG